MPSPAGGPTGRTQRGWFSDAFSGAAALSEPGRTLLVKRLGADGRGDDPLSKVQLGDVCDAKRRQELRSWFESAFALGWDRAMLRPRELGGLVPPARRVPDGRLGPRGLDQRVRLALERAGHSRWSEVLDLTVGRLLDMPGLGPTTVVSALAACFERSLIGLSMGVETYDGSDLAVLMTEERRGPQQPVLESLLDAATTDREAPGANALKVEAAHRILASSAPWALERVSALSELVSGIIDDQDRSIFIRTELRSDRRSLAELAEELGISSARVAQRRDRAGVQVREELAAAPAPLGWLVERVRRSLGRATTPGTIHAVLRRFGLDPSDAPQAKRAAELLLWLAGPFDPVARCPGWRCVQPDGLVSQTRKILIQDGGVRSLAATEASLAELGLTTASVRPWLRACGAAVVDDDLVVWLSGSLVEVLERLMDASGRGLTLAECSNLLRNGGRSIRQSELQRALRSRRFRRVTDEVYELANWTPESEGTRSSRPPSTRQRGSPRSSVADSAAAFGREQPTEVPRIGGRLNRGLLGAPGGTSDSDPNEQLGLPGITKPETAGFGDDSAQVWRSGSGWTVTELDTDDPASRRVWLTATVDDDLMKGRECSVSDGIVRGLGIGWRQRRTFSSRYGPVTLANDESEPSRGPLRPIAMAAGAGPGDVLVLGFAPEGDVVVEVRAAKFISQAAAAGSEPAPTGRHRAGSQVDDATDEMKGAT